MLLQEKLQSIKLSNAERGIAEKILELQEDLEDYATPRLAKETFTTPAAIVRLTKKLGFSGWSEFKKAYLKELQYLKGAFQEVDANYPFSKDDTEEQIIHNIGAVYTESIKDTLKLIDVHEVHKAVNLLKRSKRVVIFAVGNVNFAVSEFVFLMERIGKYVYINTVNEMCFHIAQQMEPDECAIVVSYSGETPYILRVLNQLEMKRIPVIAVTSIGGNSLSKRAYVSLPLSTRERVYSKIGGFASITSIRLVLDILYSCYYARDFERNTEYKINVAKGIETDRKVKNDIVSDGLNRAE